MRSHYYAQLRSYNWSHGSVWIVLHVSMAILLSICCLIDKVEGTHVLHGPRVINLVIYSFLFNTKNGQTNDEQIS
jgi:hypothetical protein